MRLNKKTKKRIKELIPDLTNIPKDKISDEVQKVVKRLQEEGLVPPDRLEDASASVSRSLHARKRGLGSHLKRSTEVSRANSIPSQEKQQENIQPVLPIDEQSLGGVEQANKQQVKTNKEEVKVSKGPVKTSKEKKGGYLMGAEEDIKRVKDSVEQLAKQMQQMQQNMPAQFVEAMNKREEQQRSAQAERDRQEQLKKMQDTLSTLQADLKTVQEEREKGLEELKKTIGESDTPLAQRIQKVEELTGKYCSEDPNNPICQLAIKSINEQRKKEAQQAEGEEKKGEGERTETEHTSAADFLACEECGPFFVDAAAKSIDFVRKVLDKLPSEQKARIIAQRCTGEGCETLINELEKQGIRVERKRRRIVP